MNWGRGHGVVGSGSRDLCSRPCSLWVDLHRARRPARPRESQTPSPATSSAARPIWTKANTPRRCSNSSRSCATTTCPRTCASGPRSTPARRKHYKEGKRLSGFGYAETGGGFYRENVTRTTNALGGDPARDWFWNARIGGGLGYIVTDDITIDAGLDYQFRYYDDTNRRDDSDLRWNAAVIQSLDAGSQSIGVRGQASYRGGDGYRQDYGLFVNRAFVLDPDNEIVIEGEVRSREYPRGDERNLSRDVAQAWLGWTRALMDGRAAVTVTLNGGREWATNDREGGDQTIYGAQIDWSMDFNERLGAFLYGFWEHNGTHEDIPYENAYGDPGLLRPDLDIYELGGGLTYTFAPGWSLRPEVLYIRDEGDAEFSDYSATEIWVNVRKYF